MSQDQRKGKGTGSASDSVAAGVVFTIPAILLMGYDLDISRVAVLATVGGLMGVLMMIPLRRALIVKEHDTLIYPEGTACAEVLIAGEERGLQAKRVFQAFGLGFVYKFLMGGLKLWPDVPGKEFRFYPGAAISSEISPELMGVGYIIGPRDRKSTRLNSSHSQISYAVSLDRKSTRLNSS